MYISHNNTSAAKYVNILRGLNKDREETQYTIGQDLSPNDFKLLENLPKNLIFKGFWNYR